MNIMPSVRSPEPNIVTIESDSHEPTMPYGYGRQEPIILPSLNNLNPPRKPFNIPATMAAGQSTPQQCDKRDSPQSTEPSDPSPSLTLPMNIRTNESWETSSDAGMFISEDEPRRIYLLSSPSLPPPPRKQKKKFNIGMSFSRRGGV